jgi:twitching motility protein PilT
MLPEQLVRLLTAGVHHGASDIHFRPGAAPLYRVRGELRPLKHDKLKPADTEAIALHILSRALTKDQVAELQEYDTSYSLPGVSRFRVNVYRQRGSLALVLRIIPPEVPTLEKLGLPEVVGEIARSERGLVLVTGATGSGKSSTLAAMIDHINQTRSAHIITIEDPLEFLHRNVKASISQREIGSDTRNYVTGLRAALRQDPDVILVGEMRDSESVDIALKASETGHLVFSTVHTTDAAKTIGRLISVFPAEEQAAVRLRLADNMRASISQRLLQRTDGKGRCAALEIMLVTGTIRNLIRDQERTDTIKDAIEEGRDQYGMRSFDQHLTELYHQGAISLETALQTATNPSDFERALTYE